MQVDGKRGDVYVGKGGDSVGTKKVSVTEVEGVTGLVQRSSSLSSSSTNNAASTGTGNSGSTTSVAASKSSNKDSSEVTRSALRFFFSDEGFQIREFILEETCNYVDALSRDSVRELFLRLGVSTSIVPPILRKLAPKLTEEDRKAVDGISKLVR
jgi:hypothetical protein